MGFSDWSSSLKGLRVAGGRYEVREVLEERYEGLTLAGTDVTNADAEVVIRVLPESDLDRRRLITIRDRLMDIRARQFLAYDVAQLEDHSRFGFSLILVRPMGAHSLEHVAATGLDSQSDTVGAISATLIDGLTALHEQALVHGGLRPANILYDGGDWRLADYSLNTFGDRRFLPITRRVDAEFVAPEVLYGGELTAAADVFSFGRVCLWLLERLSHDWQVLPEYEALRYVIAQAQVIEPRRRPAMSIVKDVLYAHGDVTRLRVKRLLSAPSVIDDVSIELASMSDRTGDLDIAKYRAQADNALRRVEHEIELRPHHAIRYLHTDTLVRYACVLASSTFDNQGGAIYRPFDASSPKWSSGGGFGGDSASSREQKRVSRGLDAEWRDSILKRYERMASHPIELAEDDPFVTTEMRQALAPTSTQLVEQLTDELQNASDLRASILKEEVLLTTSETIALLSQHDPSVTPDDLAQLEANRTVFSIRDHGARLYPAFQFDERGRVFSAVSDVNALFTGSTGWGIMVWWRRYHSELGDAPKSVLSEANWDLIVSAAKHSLEVD